MESIYNNEDKEAKTQQNKFWLQSNVNDILEPLMQSAIKRDPNTNMVSFRKALLRIQIDHMVKYLEQSYGDRATKGDKGALAELRKEAARLESLYEQQKVQTTGTTDDEKNADKGSENETDEDVSGQNFQ